MNNTTVMSVLGGRETFLQYSTHKEVMKWASMRMFVDLKVSADEMHAVPCRAVPCRAQLHSTMRIFAAVRTAFPRKYPHHILP